MQFRRLLGGDGQAFKVGASNPYPGPHGINNRSLSPASAVGLSCPDLSERLTILLEVHHLVFLQRRRDLYARLLGQYFDSIQGRFCADCRGTRHGQPDSRQSCQMRHDAELIGHRRESVHDGRIPDQLHPRRAQHDRRVLRFTQLASPPLRNDRAPVIS